MEIEKTKKKVGKRRVVTRLAKFLNENTIPWYRCATCRKLCVYESPNVLYTFANDYDWPDEYCADCTAHCTRCDRDYPAQDKDMHQQEEKYYCIKK